MSSWLTPTIFFTALGAVFVVLTLGVVNLVRTDAQARSRSNKLMRLRVVVQFVAIIVLVILGLVVGATAAIGPPKSSDGAFARGNQHLPLA